MANAKHPLVATSRTDAVADLIGQGLKAKVVIGCGQSTRDRLAWLMRCLGGQKRGNRFLEPTVQQMFVTLERDQPCRIRTCFLWKMKPVNCIKKEQRSNPF